MDFYHDLAVAEATNVCPSQVHTKLPCYTPRKPRIGAAGKQHQIGQAFFLSSLETGLKEWVVKWLGWQDSNLRMPGSKPGALPLGDTPIFRARYCADQLPLCQTQFALESTAYRPTHCE